MNHALGRWLKAGALMFVAVLVIAACEGPAGIPGKIGPHGDTGPTGAPGTDGASGTDGAPGTQGPIGPQGPAGGVPPVAEGTIMDVALVLGGDMATDTMDVMNYFSDPDAEEGDTLTYTASTSAPAMVTAMVAEGTSMVTVTAVAAGEAEVTVTATDADELSAMRSFMVTVTAEPVVEPDPELTTPMSFTLMAKKGSDTVTINAADYFEASMEATYDAYTDSPDIEVMPTEGTMFTIKVLNKVKDKVTVEQITSDGMSTTVTLDVVAPNQVPRLKAKRPPSSPLVAEEDMDETGEKFVYKFALHSPPFKLSDYFVDDDPGDSLSYEARVLGGDAIIGTGDISVSELQLDVVHYKDGQVVNVVVNAKDTGEPGAVDGSSKSPTIVLKVALSRPEPRIWEARQYATGFIRPALVYHRTGASERHSLQFKVRESADSVEYIPAKLLFPAVQGDTDLSNIGDDPPVVTDGVFMVESDRDSVIDTDDLEVVLVASANSVPEHHVLRFKTKRTGTANIKIMFTYPVTPATVGDPVMDTVSEIFRVDVIAVE